ncbi:MAG: MinD/ParA family protein [Treponema sp.]
MVDQAEDLRKLMKEKKDELEEIKNKHQKKTRIISVTSGKGGVGKTNIAVNLGLAYAKTGKSVIIIDADLGLANANIILGTTPEYNLYHVIRKKKHMRDIIIETSYGVKLVAGASGFSEIANMTEEDRTHFINELYELANTDIIIIDTSAGISRNVLSFLEASDEVLVVTTTEPTSIADAYGIIKTVSKEIDNCDINLKLIVNRVLSAQGSKEIAERIINIAGQFLNVKVEYLGFIYNDDSVFNAVSKQKPFFVVSPSSKASSCLKHIVAKLEKVEYNDISGGFSKFLKKLFTRR